jgi:phospholipase/carboxylesterase/glyoxalase family protein
VGGGELAGVLLHGRGGAPEDMWAVAARLALPHVRWVAPSPDGGQWYPHRFMGPRRANEPGLSDAVAICDRALADATGGGRIPASRSVIVGFSQGACLASEFVLRHPDRCRTLVMLTGGLIGPDDTAWRSSGGGHALAGLRALVTGSDADDWVPESRVRLTAAVLERLGADVDLRIYPGRPHVVSDPEIEAIRAMLSGAV